MPFSTRTPLPLAQGAGSGTKILEEKAGQAVTSVRWPDRFQGNMIASGWQTAPPQTIEVVMATKSAAPQSLEATLRESNLHSFVPSHFSRSAFWSQLFRHRAAAAGIGVLAAS